MESALTVRVLALLGRWPRMGRHADQGLRLRSVSAGGMQAAEGGKRRSGRVRL